MGTSVEIRLTYSRESHAKWAKHVVEEMIKLCFVPEDWPWAKEAENMSLMEQYFAFGSEAAKIDLSGYANQYCAYNWLKREGTRLIIERCADIQRTVYIDDGDDFFFQLCLTLARRFSGIPYRAQCRYEMTVSGAVQYTEVIYDGEALCVRQISGMLPNMLDPWRFREYVRKGETFEARPPEKKIAWKEIKSFYDLE